MEKFKVTDPKGINHNGKLYEKGEFVEIGKGAARNAFIHFKQIAKVPDATDKETEKEPAKDPATKPDGKTAKVPDATDK